MRPHYCPSKVTAAIVTSDGLCPGTNDVVQNIVFTLTDYGTASLPCGPGLRAAVCTYSQLCSTAVMHNTTSGNLQLTRSSPPL
jgi:hypothetical protein